MRENKDIWNKIFSSRKWGQYPAEDLVRFISNNFGKSKLKKKIILEIGCGPGGNLNYFLKEGFIIHGIDFSKKAIKIAQKNLKKITKLKGKLIIGDITKYQYKENYFDAIVDNEVSCCLPINQVIELYKKLSYSLKKMEKYFYEHFLTNLMDLTQVKKLVIIYIFQKLAPLRWAHKDFQPQKT